MELNNLLNLKNRNELREWLIQNHNIEKECWIVVKRGIPKDEGVFWYLDAVEEALCFGWIDSTTKKISDTETAQRLSPRRRRSPWTELNKERCRRMEKLGLMTPAGRAVFPDMTVDGFVIDKEIIEELQREPQIWANFQKFPPLYQRIRVDTIQTNKKNAEVFKNRLEKLIKNTRECTMYGDWDDNGRLSDY